MQIGVTCKRYNIVKVYVSLTLLLTRAFFNIGQINEIIKELCNKNTFVIIDHHQNIISDDLSADGIHLKIQNSNFRIQNSNVRILILRRCFIGYILHITQLS